MRPALDLLARVQERRGAVTGDGGMTVADRIDALYREESRRVLATLIRLLGDFDLAEEGLQDAFMAAAERWPRDGVPANHRGRG